MSKDRAMKRAEAQVRQEAYNQLSIDKKIEIAKKMGGKKQVEKLLKLKEQK